MHPPLGPNEMASLTPAMLLPFRVGFAFFLMCGVWVALAAFWILMSRSGQPSLGKRPARPRTWRMTATSAGE